MGENRSRLYIYLCKYLNKYINNGKLYTYGIRFDNENNIIIYYTNDVKSNGKMTIMLRKKIPDECNNDKLSYAIIEKFIEEQIK